MGIHFARKRIVIAEDHVEMARHLESLLCEDYDVDLASNARELIAAVNANVPDIIISDIAMPGMSGLTAARNILTSHPEARIIFVSIRDEPAIIRMAMSEGALGYVLKCDAGDELANAVRSVLGGRQYVSASARAALAAAP